MLPSFPAVLFWRPSYCRQTLLRGIQFEMATPSIASVQKILEGIIVPEMQSVKDRLTSSVKDRLTSMEGEIKSLRSEIERLDNKIDNELARLEERVARVDDKLVFTNKRLDEALEIRERLAALEAKVGR